MSHDSTSCVSVCNTKEFISNGKCSVCTDTMPNCVSCTSASVCTKCKNINFLFNK